MPLMKMKEHHLADSDRANGKLRVMSALNRPKKKAEEAEEIGGPAGPDPIRYGDWECKGRCSDF